MNTSNPIIFYDIASGPPVRPYAPNPWKTRYALNFKRVRYETQWVELPDVASTRRGLGAPPVRSHADGSDFNTLPAIDDGGTVVGDSLDIALHLDDAYPAGPPLFPPATRGLHRAFNAHVDGVFSGFVVLVCHGLPFNPATAEASRAEFVRRTPGVSRWEELGVSGDARRDMCGRFEDALGGLAKVFLRREEGPFLEGKDPMYADLIVGGWLAMMEVCMPKEEWEVFLTWQGGLWKRLHEALQERFGKVN